VPPVPRERCEVAGVARQDRGVLPRWRVPAARAEPADHADLGGLGQRAEQRIAQRPWQQTGGPGAARRTGQFGDAPAPHRLDQRLDKRRRGGLDLIRMPEIVRQHVQFPERHHQAAPGQAQRAGTGVSVRKAPLVRVARVAAELFEQVAVGGDPLGAGRGSGRAAGRHQLELFGGDVTEQRVLPRHVALDHRRTAGRAWLARHVEDERPARHEGVRGSVRGQFFRRAGRRHRQRGGRRRHGHGADRLLYHVGDLVRQQPQSRPRPGRKRPICEVDVRAHGERPGAQRPSRPVRAGCLGRLPGGCVMQPDRGEVNAVRAGPVPRREKVRECRQGNPPP